MDLESIMASRMNTRRVIRFGTYNVLLRLNVCPSWPIKIVETKSELQLMFFFY